MQSYRRRTASLCAMYGVLSMLICAPLFAQPNGVGLNDWDVHLFYYGSVLKSVIEYAQLPFWNPWYCGGNVLWQNPQVALLSPVYPLATVLSLPLAMKVNIVLHYWIGFIGMHLLLRRVVGVRFLPLVIYLACVFVASGALALHVAEGHYTFLAAFYLPLQLFWFCRAIASGTVREALLAGAMLALMVFSGGLHIVPMSIAGIGTMALVAAGTQRRWRPILLAVVVGAAGVAYAAPKLLPVVTYLRSDRFEDARGFEVPHFMTLEMLQHAYLDPHQTSRSKFQGTLYGWHEYGNYIGLPAVVLIAAALVWTLLWPRVRTRWLGLSLALMAVMLFTLSLGEFSALSPATLMRSAPLFSRFRVPTRYTLGFVLFATTLVGWAVAERSLDVALTKRVKALAAAICLLASLDLILRNGSHFSGIFAGRPLERGFTFLHGPSELVTDAAVDPYGPESPMLRALMTGRSSYNCYEPLRLIRTADPEKSLVFTDGNVTLIQTVFTPNRIDVTVVGRPNPSRLLVNQNYAPGWQSALGPVTVDPQYKTMSVAVPPGATGTYAIGFVPPGLAAGSLVFVLALIASAGLWKATAP